MKIGFFVHKIHQFEHDTGNDAIQYFNGVKVHNTGTILTLNFSKYTR